MIPNAYRGKLREALNEGGSETIIYVDSLETINGETLDFSKFTPYRGILTIDPYGEYPEWVSFTGINTVNNSFTGVTRGLSALDNTVVSGNKFFHAEETDVVLTWGVHNGLDIPQGGAVDSVNGQTGVVVLDADDIDDTSTTQKFVTATDITNLSNLSGTNTGDQDLSTYIVGPATATDNAIARYDNTTGKLIQNSGVTIGDANNTIITIADTSNVVGLTINQNDVTNNPTALKIINAGTGTSLEVQSTNGGTSGAIIDIYSNSSSPADTGTDDAGAINFYANNDLGVKTKLGGIVFEMSDSTSGTEDGDIEFLTRRNGSLSKRHFFNSTGSVQFAGSSDTTSTSLTLSNDSSPFGQVTLSSSNSDSFSLLNGAGNGISVSALGAVQVNTLELGHATDTTLSRLSAGVLAVEGIEVPTISSTNTLTNKTLTAPVFSGNITHQGGIMTVGGDNTNTGAIQLQPANPAYNWYSIVNKEVGGSEGIAIQRGSYPAVVSTPMTLSAGGNVVFAGTVTATGGTFTGNIIPGVIQGGTSAGVTSVAGAQYLSSINTTYHWRTGAVSATPTTNYNYTGVNLISQTITEAATGTHALIANLAVGAPDIVEGAGSTTNAATVYIEGAPTGTATITNKYALWVDDGAVKFDTPGNATGNALTTDATQTITNKRITKRTGTTTSSATPTINTDNVDFYSLTAQAASITSMTTNLSGTPTEGQTLWLAITGTGTYDITWGTSFESSTVTLPTTGAITTSRKDFGFVWNSVTSKWRIIALA